MMKILIVFFFVAIVNGAPPCTNWCPSPYGYGGMCCDVYPGGHYTSPCESSTSYCPLVNCTVPGSSILKDCDSDDDCLRKEKCCDFPCTSDDKMKCLVTVDKEPFLVQCPRIKNCATWIRNNPTYTQCTNDDDCKRKESCCTNPCTVTKVCLVTVKSSISVTNLGLNNCGPYC